VFWILGKGGIEITSERRDGGHRALP
jgi:hypothetical protein